jgi:hypothetical protein
LGQSGADQRELKVWALLGPHRGDNNQVLALAEALGIPFETRQFRYNRWRYLQPRLLGASLLGVSRDSRALALDRPPDLTISTGHRSVPVVQFIRQRSGGRTRSVHIGFPRLSPDRFDLVVATPEYPIPDHPNVMRIPVALNRAQPAAVLDDQADTWSTPFARPRRLLVLGGPSLYWSLRSGDVAEALSSLLDRAAIDKGSILVVGSPRTPSPVLRAVDRQLATSACPAMLVPMNGPPTDLELLRAADQIFVTADSVAMVSEAVTSGKPVGLVAIRPTLGGRIYMWLTDRIWPGTRTYPRDLRFFWKTLDELHLVGTVADPTRGSVPNVLAEVADRVLRLIA